jgi:D-glycero-D-manno-heptose 1,7-bisphosphate phosphatase
MTDVGEMRRRRFAVLDRDGTVIEECDYLSDPEQVRLIPGVGRALRELKEMGFGLVVITNQSGVGRGFFDKDQLRRIHERLHQQLEGEGVRVDGLYFCPHRPDDDCVCRKPNLGLIQKASEELGFTLESSIVIGDKISDIEMGRRVNATTILVRTGYGAEAAAAHGVAVDYIVDDLPGAVEVIRRLPPTDNTVVGRHQ